MKREEKEKERSEMINNHNCIMLVNYVNVNEIKVQKYGNKNAKMRFCTFKPK